MPSPTPLLLRIGLLAAVVGFGGSRPGLAQQSPASDGRLDAGKSFAAMRIEEPWRIDGLPEASLIAADPQSGFRQNTPHPGAPAAQPTEVWVGYDDEAIYVFARLYDSAPDSILRQLSERDRLRNTDFFAVSVNPYRDGINASNFVVTPANVQYDARFGADNGGSVDDGDASWDAVWASATRIDSAGWTAELRIPFAMLRFTDAAVQRWDINFARQLRRRRELSYWNFVDPAGPGTAAQMGELVGLRDLRPPVRLQATPFVTVGLADRYDPGATPRNSLGSSLGGGLDVKYGLSDAFTLDMTLVPDFSNARSDDQVLNLTANEIAFDENRAFFTEGTELFNKGNFFYSRRIGGPVFDGGAVSRARRAGEVVVDNPARPQLLNATKVSGRLANGLGIGAFTAVEGATQARLRDTLTGGERSVATGPLTGFSVVALDQNLPHNSFATLINTTVWRAGAAYDANLTGLVWDLRDATNAWGLSGRAAVSQQYGRRDAEGTRTDVFGHTLNLTLARISGRLRGGLGYVEESDTYDANDLGLLFFNNERSAEAYGEYNWFEPFGAFNSASVGMWTALGYLYEPRRYNYLASGGHSRFTTRDFFTFGASGFTDLRSKVEFQDSRTPGVGLEMPAWGELSGFISSDYRKPFALDVRVEYGRFWRDAGTNSIEVRVSPRARLGDRFALRFSSEYRANERFWGYVGHGPRAAAHFGLATAGTRWSPADARSVGFDALRQNGILYSYRDIESFENELTLEYSFTANANLSLRARHYWSRVRHREFFETTAAGRPLASAYSGRDASGAVLHDRGFNAFNVDGFFRWRFAPGSDAFLSYKTQSFYAGLLERGYASNLGALGQDIIDNSLTLKVIYWLDYNSLRSRGRS